jgi:tetratricopeptide (TPR) repeat protein
VFGADYRALVRRAKIVFNRSIRGECNLRAVEAASGGAVLLQEADNGETAQYLKADAEFVRYTEESRSFGHVGEAEAESLLGRSLTTRGEYALAREMLERAVARFPSSVPVRAAYSYALLKGGFDPIEAEAALREVLKLDPNNAQAKRNLEALYRNTGRWVEGVLDPPAS